MTRFGVIETPPQGGAETEVEYVAWFRFPVTWTYLKTSLPEAEPALRIRPVAKASPAPAMALVPAIPTPPPKIIAPFDPGPSDLGPRDPVPSGPSAAPAAQWEMVIPKMVRPAVKPVVDRLPAAPATAPAPAKPDISASSAPVEIAAPAFTLPEGSRLSRYWRPLALLTIILMAIGFTLWVRPAADTSHPGQAAEWTNRGGWVRRSLLPPGRLMSVYEPSRDEADYRLEFGWVPDSKGVGWVFRTRDAGDYYAARVSLLQPGASVTLVAEHFSVVGGVESAHSRKVVPFGSNAGLIRVRMDAIGPAFTLSLQGSPVDYWTDARLNSGALGFYDELGQRPVVQSLRFTFIKKGVTRVAVASLP